MHRTAADLRAAEAAAAAAGAAADEEMPDFEAEEAAEVAAEAEILPEAASSQYGGREGSPPSVPGEGLTEEDGVEELLQELQEEQAQQAQQVQQAQQAAPGIAPATPGGGTPATAGAAPQPTGANPATTAAPLPQPHPRLKMYTLSSRWGFRRGLHFYLKLLLADAWRLAAFGRLQVLHAAPPVPHPQQPSLFR